MGEQDPIELAARALQHRDRSRRELEERLARAGIDEGRRNDALETLERVGYVDDERFAGARADGPADAGPQAPSGVSASGSAEAIAALVPEAERAAALVERLGSTPKTGAQLTRKGFGQEALEAALRIDAGD